MTHPTNQPTRPVWWTHMLYNRGLASGWKISYPLRILKLSEITSQCVQFVEEFKPWVTHSRAYLTSLREGDATTLWLNFKHSGGRWETDHIWIELLLSKDLGRGWKIIQTRRILVAKMAEKLTTKRRPGENIQEKCGVIQLLTDLCFYLSKFHQRDKIQLDAVCHVFTINTKKMYRRNIHNFSRLF